MIAETIPSRVAVTGVTWHYPAGFGKHEVAETRLGRILRNFHHTFDLVAFDGAVIATVTTSRPVVAH